MPIETNVKGVIQRQLPAADSDNDAGGLRLGRYHDMYVLPSVQKSHVLADEGSYFVATNPSPGTAIAYAVTAAFSDTAGAYLAVKNNDSASNSNYKRLHLDYVKLICTTVPASATAAFYAIKVDNVNRYSSGGTVITPANVNIDQGNATVSQVYAGTPTLTAAGPSARVVGRGTLRGVIPTANDEYVINFGGIEGGGSYVSAAASGRVVSTSAPVVIGPQQWALVHLWFPSNASTASQFEFEVGWWER